MRRRHADGQCGTCLFWEGDDRTDWKAYCRHPSHYLGLEFVNEETGKRKFVRSWTTGCCHACKDWRPGYRPTAWGSGYLTGEPGEPGV